MPFPAALPDADARTMALRRFRDFCSRLDFARIGDSGGGPKTFRVPRDNVLVEWPDDPKDLRMPAIGVVPARGQAQAVALGPPDPIEDSVDVYGRGTVLYTLGEYVETLTVEVWGSHKAERSSLVAGLGAALRASEESLSLRLRLPDYFGQVAEFSFTEVQYVDEPDVVRGRRRAQLFVELRVPEVRLGTYSRLLPRVVVAVADDVVDVSEVVVGGPEP